MIATACWFCHHPIRSGERAHRSPQGEIAVHADCLRHDALTEGVFPSDEDRTERAWMR